MSKRKPAEFHGLSKRPEYSVWHGIINRCTNPNHKAFKNYGGRGIRICDEWRESFAAFLQYMGPRPAPNFTVERIDNDGHYEPGNVKWLLEELQHRNTSQVHRVHYKGCILSVRQCMNLSGHSERVIKYRITQGFTADEIVDPRSSRQLRRSA